MVCYNNSKLFLYHPTLNELETGSVIEGQKGEVLAEDDKNTERAGTRRIPT